MAKRTVIRGARAVSMDPEIGVLDRADILMEGERIAAVAPEIQVGDAESIDASGMIAIPGMVDTHRHLWHTPFRGVDFGNFEYFVHLMLGARRSFRPEDGYVATHAGALECLDAGVTTVVDFHDLVFADGHAEEAVRGLEDAGIRGLFCYGMIGMPSVARGLETSVEELIPTTDWHFEDARKLRTGRLASDDALVTMGLAARELELLPFACTPPELALGRELGVHITAHAGLGTPGQSGTWIQKLREADLLGPDLFFSHGQRFTDSDLDWIAEAGASVAISPECELAEGAPVITSKALERGANISLGVDSTYSVGADLFRQMQFALGIARGDRARVLLEQECFVTTMTPSPWEMLEAATLGGARAIGLEDRIGSLTPGKQADLVLLRTDRIGLTPMPDPLLSVVMHMEGGDVDSVWVAGRARKREGRLVDADVAALAASLARSRHHLDEGMRNVDVDALRQLTAALLSAA